MASVQKTAAGTYRARWRDAQGRTQQKSGFRTKTEARQYAVAQEAAVANGSYINPSAGKLDFQTYAESWRIIQTHRPGTALQVEGNLRRHAYPAIGSKPLKAIKRSDIQALLKTASMTIAPATVEVVFRYVSAIFSAAVADKLIPENPCKGIRPPKPEKVKVEPMAAEEVLAMVEAVPERYKALIILTAGTGLRQGEAFGLSVDRVDFLRRVLKVDRQLQLQAGVGAVLVPPKTQASYRTIPLADAVVVALSEHLRTIGQSEEGLIFSNEKGLPMNRHRFADTWNRAAGEAGVIGKTFHDLRHWYASILIRSGASVKVVQSRLGHASAMETLDTYAHLFPDEEDRSRQAVEEVLGKRAIEEKSLVADN